MSISCNYYINIVYNNVRCLYDVYGLFIPQQYCLFTAALISISSSASPPSLHHLYLLFSTSVLLSLSAAFHHLLSPTFAPSLSIWPTRYHHTSQGRRDEKNFKQHDTDGIHTPSVAQSISPFIYLPYSSLSHVEEHARPLPGGLSAGVHRQPLSFHIPSHSSSLLGQIQNNKSGQ